MAEPVKLPEPIKGLKNDKEIWIAVGKSRSDKKWQNKEMKWSVFLRRFKEPTRTQESYKDFLKMSATEQGRIKDVGGFVGGTLEGGRRKADAVKERYLLAFDLDFATTDFLEEFDMLCLNASMIYSTHKHSPEKPRYRLIMPTSRPVTPDEYEALMRIVAKELDIMPLLDPSTFQPSRLMYWASCSQDAEYVFRYWDLPFIDPDEWLAKLPDWTDISFWPVHPDEYRVDKTKRGQKQQDPTEKKNLVGVFCRTYDVPAAISTFLADIYEPTVNEDRYTYRPGSTSGGLVIYDDGKFCYSNHGTDPASGMDLNAFDLVRVHLFGDEDDNAKDDTPVNRMPSFKAMEDFVKEDPDCKMTMLHERAQSAAEDFDDDFDPEALEVVDDDWMKKLEFNRSGLVKSAKNLSIILANDPKLVGIRYNTFAGRIEIQDGNPVPWRKDCGAWRSSDSDQLFMYVGKKYVEFPQRVMDAALTEATQRRQYHPVKEYLKGLPEWDGVERVETMLIDYLGADDNLYVREATKVWMRAAVARIFVPGCKFDYVPVVSGPGGIGKSTLMYKLGVNWFSDSLTFEDMRDKTAAEKIQGVWINEISELKGMRKMDVETIKSFISRQTDRYRIPYAKVTDDFPRSCVFIGTSNDEHYLMDVTGNRRFWPIKVTGQGLLDPWFLTEEEVGQMWAEAYADFKKQGTKKLLLSKAAEILADEAQTDALETDAREGLIQAFMEIPVPDNWYTRSIEERRQYFRDFDEDMREAGSLYREDISVIEIWCECFGFEKAKIRRKEQNEIIAMLTRLGYEKAGQRNLGGGYGRPRVYALKTPKAITH